MKVFFKRVIVFIFFLFLLCFLALQGLGYLNRQLLKDYKNDPVFNTVLIGDSHVQKAIDDRRLLNTINMAQYGERYVFSYVKLKLLLESHPGIRRVLLGCGYHNLSSMDDRFISMDDSIDVSKRYFFLLQPGPQLQTLWDNRNDGFLYLRKAIKRGCNNLIAPTGTYSFAGYYDSRDSLLKTCVNIAAVKRRISKLFYKGEDYLQFSAVNISDFQKIIDLCKSRGVELIILNTPMSAIYKERVPSMFKEKFDSLMEGNKLKVIDFNNLVTTDSCFLPDGDHLSRKGAIITTDYLKGILENR